MVVYLELLSDGEDPKLHVLSTMGGKSLTTDCNGTCTLGIGDD